MVLFLEWKTNNCPSFNLCVDIMWSLFIITNIHDLFYPDKFWAREGCWLHCSLSWVWDCYRGGQEDGDYISNCIPWYLPVFIITTICSNYLLHRTIWHQLLDARVSCRHSSCSSFHFSVWVVLSFWPCCQGRLLILSLTFLLRLIITGVFLGSWSQILCSGRFGWYGRCCSKHQSKLSKRFDCTVNALIANLIENSSHLMLAGSCPAFGHFLQWSSWPSTRLTLPLLWFPERSITTCRASRIQRSATLTARSHRWSLPPFHTATLMWVMHLKKCKIKCVV